jgi:hypothetical protein
MKILLTLIAIFIFFIIFINIYDETTIDGQDEHKWPFD